MKHNNTTTKHLNKNTVEQTAVEWIEGYLKKFNHIEESLSIRKAIEKAKEMEEQQIKNVVISTFKAVDGYCFGMTAEEYYEEYLPLIKKRAELYYNEKFK